MPSKPIVSRLEVNLGWKAWLKPFLIHPSVTAAAAKDMRVVQAAKQRLQAAKQHQIPEVELSGKVMKLLTGLVDQLPGSSVQQADILRLIASRDSNQNKVARAWKIVHSADPELRVQLRELFKPLQMDPFTFYLDIASQLKNEEALLSELEWTFANSFDHDSTIRSISHILLSVEDDTLKASLRERIDAYDDEKPQEVTSTSSPASPAEAEVSRSVNPYVNRKHILQGAFLKTFGLDGYESTSTELVDAQGEQYSYDHKNRRNLDYPTVPFSLVLMTFLGFPTRLNGKANLNLREIIRNLFGGWDSLNNGKSDSWFWWLNPTNYIFQGKRLWNVIFFPIKLVIFALKLATLPLKFALNVLKLVTEFLPEVILHVSGFLVGLASGMLLRRHYDNDPWHTKIFDGTISMLILIVSVPIHYAARLLALVGTAATSPEKSARMAWNYGRALNSPFGYVFAFIGAAISVALTATLWAITFPLVFAKALVLFPSLAPLVTSIAQWSIVAKTLAYINGAATLVAGTVPAAFSLAATAISAAFGVSVSAMTLAVATTLAIIVAPVASIASRVMDGLSNLWTYWPARSPLLIDHAGKSEVSVVTLARRTVKSAAPSIVAAPSMEATALVKARHQEDDSVEMATNLVDERAQAKPAYYAQTTKVAAQGIYCEPARVTEEPYVPVGY